MFDKLNMDNLNMGDLVQKIEDNAKNLKDNNSSKIFTASSGGDMVVASMNGNGELVDLEIDNSLMDDKESLQILLIAAINEVSATVESSKVKAQRDMAMSMLANGNIFGNK